jgi:uncharacterized protein (TIGR03437 family)
MRCAFPEPRISLRFAIPWLCLCSILHSTGDGPELAASDVVNAADYSGGRVAPGEIVVLFPSNVGPEVMAGAQLGGDGRVTTSLADTRVLFDGIPAPIAYSMKGQVGAIVPYGIAKKRTTQIVVEYQGVPSPPVTLPVVDSVPALFTLDSSGKGQAAMLNETGCCNSARNPSARGAIAVLYATGVGQTVPRGVDGRVAAHARIADYPAPRLPVRVTVGGKPAEIIYSAAAPHAIAGLLQVNFRVPANAPIGDAVPLVLIVGNAHSSDAVTMAVRSPIQRVLVIDNEPTIRNWLGSILTRAGYEVLTSSNDRKALTQANGRPVDLVISNLVHHEQERLETIRALRMDRPQIRIVAIAGTLSPDVLRAADLLGAQAVLTKPMGTQAVVRRVRELLRSRPVPYVASEEPPKFPSTRKIAR